MLAKRYDPLILSVLISVFGGVNLTSDLAEPYFGEDLALERPAESKQEAAQG